MADTGIFATTQEVQDHVGARASATYNTEACINRFIAQVESYINNVTNTNFSDTYAAHNNDVKKVLTLWAAALTANMVIKADISTIGVQEATFRINTNLTIARDCEQQIKTQFIKRTA